MQNLAGQNQLTVYWDKESHFSSFPTGSEQTVPEIQDLENHEACHMTQDTRLQVGGTLICKSVTSQKGLQKHKIQFYKFFPSLLILHI